MLCYVVKIVSIKSVFEGILLLLCAVSYTLVLITLLCVLLSCELCSLFSCTVWHVLLCKFGFLFVFVKQNILNLQMCPSSFCVCVLYVTDIYYAPEVLSEQESTQQQFSFCLLTIVFILVWTRLLHCNEHHGDILTVNLTTADDSLIHSFWWRGK
jgi:hypothetical protein